MTVRNGAVNFVSLPITWHWSVALQENGLGEVEYALKSEISFRFIQL